MTENKRYEFDVMNGGGYVVGYSERMSDDISFFTRLCEVPTKTQAEKVCNELKGLQKENEQLKADNNRLVNETAKVVAEHQRKVLDLIDDKIDELEEQYKFGQEVYRGCPMHNIGFGINVLKELKRELSE
jgi:hypothetical protein